MLTTVGRPKSPDSAGLVHAAVVRHAHVDIEASAAAENRFAQHPMRVRDVDGATQGADRVRVLTAHIDIAIAGAHREGRDDHPLDEGEWVAFDEYAVREGPAVALVGVAAHELLVTGRRAHRLPFDARREAGATAATQTRGRHFGDDLLGSQRQRPLEPTQSAVFAIGREVGRLDDPHPGEGDAVLAGQPRVVIDHPKAPLGVVEDAGEQGRNIGGRHIAKADATPSRFELDEWLKPEHPARTIAPHRNPRGHKSLGDGIGADGDGDGVARHPGRRHTDHPWVRAATRAGESAAYSAPSTVPHGPMAHRPKQNTSATSTSAEPAHASVTAPYVPSAPRA